MHPPTSAPPLLLLVTCSTTIENLCELWWDRCLRIFFPNCSSNSSSNGNSATAPIHLFACLFPPLSSLVTEKVKGKSVTTEAVPTPTNNSPTPTPKHGLLINSNNHHQPPTKTTTTNQPTNPNNNQHDVPLGPCPCPNEIA